MSDSEIIKSVIEIIPPVFATAATMILPIILVKQNNQDKKIESIKQTGEATHTLQNSSYLAALKAVAVLSRAKADKSKKVADKIAAEAAEAKVTEHEQAQAKVDAMPEKADV